MTAIAIFSDEDRQNALVGRLKLIAEVLGIPDEEIAEAADNEFTTITTGSPAPAGLFVLMGAMLTKNYP